MSSISEIYHHWRYGEQNRYRNRAQQGIATAGISLRELSALELLAGSRVEIPTDPAVIWGCDFAGVYDGTPDMAKFKARGGRLVWFKAADGTIKAKLVDENIANAQAQGLVTGAYFWLYRNARISGSAQASAWWNIVKGKALDFCVVDFEWTSWMGKPDNPDTSDLWGVVDPFQQLSGVPMWIYSAPGYLSEYFNHSDKFKANPFIVAQYGVLQPAGVLPWGDNGHTMWQCSDTWPGLDLGVSPYSSTAEDGDIFNGTLEQFNLRFGRGGGTAPVPPPPPPDVAIIDVVSLHFNNGRTVDLVRK